MESNAQLILNFGLSPCLLCFIFFNETPFKMMKNAFYIYFHYYKSSFRSQDT